MKSAIFALDKVRKHPEKRRITDVFQGKIVNWQKAEIYFEPPPRAM